MWYIKFSWTILVLVGLIAAAAGSCLEYGHSCWGAHGKRSGGKAVLAVKQSPISYAIDSMAEQLYNNANGNNNNNNNVQDDDDDNSNNNTNNNLPLSETGLGTPNGETAVDIQERERNRNRKWTQLMRLHRFKHQQQQQQQRGQGVDGRGQYDASNMAAESWRKLQQALLLAEQAEQQQPLYELSTK
ncbi:neuropeptide CCHamide-1 [Drosophila tropicalis]|uniref:neuropeptide CCHamide-1 n=1 Tax=Drosophila tropicalis TaxID=46794 RepID=UPI0035AB820E